MRFTIPQFIDREPKIIGPLTFNQFIYIGIVGAVCFFLYFTVSTTVFILASTVLLGGGMALALLKKNGIPLPKYIGNFLKFHLSPKMYLWKREEGGGATEMGMAEEEEAPEDETPLKVAPKSRLKNKKKAVDTSRSSS